MNLAGREISTVGRQTQELEDARAEANLYSEQFLKSQEELRAAKDRLKPIEDGGLEAKKVVTLKKDQNALLTTELEWVKVELTNYQAREEGHQV